MRAGEVTEESERGAARPPEVPRAPASPLFEVRSVSKRFGPWSKTDSVSEFADYVVLPATTAQKWGHL